MTAEPWLAALEREVSDSANHMRSASATVKHGAQQALHAVEVVLRALDKTAARRARPIPQDRHRKVVDAVRRRDFAALSLRDQRYAARLFGELTATEMQELLLARPGNWKTYATACLDDWEQFRAAPERSGHERLLCIAPAEVAFIHQPVRAAQLVLDSGPRTLAATIEGDGVPDARAWLTSRGFASTWSFTGTSLAYWVWERVNARRSVALVWNELANDAVAETMLLPPRRDSRQSWFGSAERPARVRAAVHARALFASALLRAILKGGPGDAASTTSYIDVMLRSEFGDPRVPPLSKGWNSVRLIDESIYRDFLAALVADDLKVFFQHAMSDSTRERFWLRYLRSIQRTTCVLGRSTYARLHRQLASDKQLGAAIGRAKQFEKETTSAHAFCLYFERHVIVEFSETGNAAYIYDRGAFDKHLQRQIDDDACPDHTKLKRPELRPDRILHMPANGWEAKAASKLFLLGIRPD